MTIDMGHACSWIATNGIRLVTCVYLFFVLLKLHRFDPERNPERVVHTRGAVVFSQILQGRLRLDEGWGFS